MDDVSKLLSAAAFSAKKHIRQRRKGANREPYINHPLEVAELLSTVGRIADCDILAAAILHDTLEDTDAGEEELIQKFGDDVLGYVKEVTDDRSLTKKERKTLQIQKAPALSDGAKQIKLADKISNLTDILLNPPEDWTINRRLEYVDWCVNVISGVRGINSNLERAFDEIVDRAYRRLRN